MEIVSKKNNSQISADYFRSILFATSYPGSIETLKKIDTPLGMFSASCLILKTLCDSYSNIFLGGDVNNSETIEWIKFNTGANITNKKNANFAVGFWKDLIPFKDFKIGDEQNPDQSCTIICQYQFEKPNATITGPGIKSSKSIFLPDKEIIKKNNQQFPLGLDFYFVDNEKFYSIPRSLKIGVL
jgi:alpha-D-ribose 1-methylphosphonate 5-triphosphate synthase subunit PhnH|tara:strand:- start:52 stop:606 length:555 start_codon:yes stop_codon:yes gene_type:complete